MKKESIQDIINSLRSRRDALGYAHEKLKQDSDSYNKIIIVISLMTGALESIKMKLHLTAAAWSLAPILLSSIIAATSALMKFKNYPTRMESITQASSVLNNCLSKARNHQNDPEINPDLMADYNASLLACETAIYPSERKAFVVQANKNLLAILKAEQKYFDAVDDANSGISIKISGSDDDLQDFTDIELNPITKTKVKELSSIPEDN
tara:strand:+ start:3152 stop:3778 length:627 start_codon:yes stop_codon:yes gene_type:complete